jgi:hypothetical protein
LSNDVYIYDPSSQYYWNHDRIAEHALDWLPVEEKAFILDNLAVYLYGTELPDNGAAPDGIGDTAKHHVYYFANGTLQDDSSAVRAQQEFEKAVSLYLAGQVPEAVKRLGVMTHYISDVAVFGHVMGASTDWGVETHHSDYETYVNERSNSYDDEFNVFLSFDGALETISAYNATLQLAYDTTFDVDGNLTCVWMDTHYNWSDPTFRGRCGESLNLAVNLVADVLHTFYLEIEHVHDLAINVTIPLSEVYVGQKVEIVTSTKNEGSVPENLSCINVYADSVFNETLHPNVVLDPGEVFDWIFFWYTADVAPGNYTIVVEVKAVAGEQDVADNTAIAHIRVKSDDYPPVIYGVSQSPEPDKVEPYQNVTVSVWVHDEGSGVKAGILSYSVNGSIWHNVSMEIWIACGNFFLKASIPGFPTGTEVRYWIKVWDRAGNVAVMDNAGQYYTYTVIPELSIHAVFLAFVALTLLAALFRRKH